MDCIFLHVRNIVRWHDYYIFYILLADHVKSPCKKINMCQDFFLLFSPIGCQEYDTGKWVLRRIKLKKLENYEAKWYIFLETIIFSWFRVSLVSFGFRELVWLGDFISRSFVEKTPFLGYRQTNEGKESTFHISLTFLWQLIAHYMKEGGVQIWFSFS